MHLGYVFFLALRLVRFTVFNGAQTNTGGLQQEFILEAYAMGQKQNPIILKSK